MPKHHHEMRTALTIAAGVAVLAGAVLVIRTIAGDDSGSSREQAIRQIERQTSAAYDCMPKEVQRRFDATLKRYQRRFGEVIERLPDDASPAEANRALGADPQVARLRTRARGILIDYAPGGDEFDRECYDSAARRFDRRPD